MFYHNYGKRILDVFLVLTGVILFWWLFALIILIFIALWEFPIFYKQERTGKDNRPFVFWKFRTLSTRMRIDIHNRVFAWGKFMRFTSLDELPQVYNVLRGDMSLVGPRPLPTEYAALYSAEQRRRHNVRPGITGWAQVNGKNSIEWSKKFELDLYYVNNLSFKFDLLILFETIAVLFSFRKDVSLKEEKFTGN